MSVVNSVCDKLRMAELYCEQAGNADLVQPWSVHDRNGTLLALSDRTAAMLGIAEAQASVHFLDLVQVSDRVQMGHFLAGQDLADNGGRISFRPQNRNVSGAAGWVEISEGNGEICAGAEGLRLFRYLDVTKSREAEASAALLQDQAEQASIAKSRFLANMSHELRTPLNAILGFSDLLSSPLASGFEEARKSEYIRLIHDSASHLLGVLNGILDMSKIEHGMYEIYPERFELSRCLKTATAIMRGQAEIRSVRIETSGFDDAPQVVADEKAVRQVLINLLSNAIKFSPEKGLVTVEATRGARTVTLTVRDQGIGISPENIDRLGTPFFQADSRNDRKYEGTGLGLSVVKGLVELHGGTVRFSSLRGEGTCVTVELPIHGNGGRKVAAPMKINVVEHLDEARAANARNGSEQAAENLRILRNIA